MSHDIYVIRTAVARYLKHIKTMDDEIREIESRIRDIRSRLEGMGVSLDGGRACGQSDKMGDGVARIMELEAEWSDRVVACHAEFNAARDMCDPHHVGRWAMWMHVVEGRTWAYVGRVIGYGERQARTIADGGARELYYLMPEQFRRDAFPNAAPL